MACRILIPQPGVDLVPPAVEAWSLNHWTSREVPKILQYSMSMFLEVAIIAYYNLKVIANNKTIKLIEENIIEHVCHPVLFK